MALNHHIEQPDGTSRRFTITTVSAYPGRGWRAVEVDEDGRMLPCPDCRQAGKVAADQNPVNEPIGPGVPARLTGAMLLNPQLPECHHPTFPGWWADVVASRPQQPPIELHEQVLAQLATNVDAVQQLVVAGVTLLDHQFAGAAEGDLGDENRT